MVASFYPSHVIGRSPHGAPAWWEAQALRQGDWVGLVSRLYSNIFAPDFLTPMQVGKTAIGGVAVLTAWKVPCRSLLNYPYGCVSYTSPKR